MRTKKFNILILIVFVFCVNGSVNALAMKTGFSTELMDLTTQQTFLSNADISLLDFEIEKKPISCFDINENGLIAIGTSISNKKAVCIYTLDGLFKYGYTFNCSGSFGVEWDKDNIILYFVRSDVAVEINSTGEIENVLMIQNTIDNNSYWNNHVFATQRIIGSDKFIIKNDMGFFNIFASSYSQLVSINNAGEKHIIYDVNSEQIVKTVLIFIGVLAFVAIVITSILVSILRVNRDNSKKYNTVQIQAEFESQIDDYYEW